MLELTLNQSGKLFSCFCSDFVDQIEQLLQSDRPIERPHFVTQQIKQAAKRAGVRALSVLPSQQDVARDYNGRVAHEQVVRTALELVLQTQQRFGALEENLDVPAHPVDSDDVLGRQTKVSRKRGKPFVFLGTMADKHDHHQDSRGERSSDETEDVVVFPFGTWCSGI